jgi:uncharacterized protein (TIRG00374 family)
VSSWTSSRSLLSTSAEQPAAGGGPGDRRRATVPIIVGLVVSAGLLWWTMRGLQLADVVRHVRGARPLPLLLSVALATLTFPLRAFRWRALLRDSADRLLPAGAAWHGIAIGYLANNVLPLRAGEILRAYAVTRLAPVRLSSAVASVAVERVFDALTVVAMLGIALLAAGLPGDVRIAGLPVSQLAQRIGLAAAVAFLLAAVVLSRPHAFAMWCERVIPFKGLARRMVALLEGIRAGLSVLRSPGRLAVVVGWSIAIWLVNALSFLALFPAFGLRIDLAGAVLVQSAIVFGIAVPSSPGYVGVFEAAIVLALALYGVAQDQALAYAVTYHAATFVPITLLGLYSLTRTPLAWRDLR